MKIEFNDEEVAALPEEVRTKIKDNIFEGDPLEFIPDVDGLKSALEVTRAEKKKAEGVVKTIAEKFGAKKGDVLTAVDDFISKNDKKGEVMKQLADERMRTVIAQAGGNVHALPENVKARMQWSDELGQYIVPGEDGEPLKTDDGSLKAVPDVVADMRADSNFGNMFASRTHSGTGSPPQKGGDGPSRLSSDGRSDSDAPPKSMRISDMNSQQRRLAATEGGGLQEYQR